MNDDELVDARDAPFLFDDAPIATAAFDERRPTRARFMTISQHQQGSSST